MREREGNGKDEERSAGYSVLPNRGPSVAKSWEKLPNVCGRVDRPFGLHSFCNRMVQIVTCQFSRSLTSLEISSMDLIARRRVSPPALRTNRPISVGPEREHVLTVSRFVLRTTGKRVSLPRNRVSSRAIEKREKRDRERG